MPDLVPEASRLEVILFCAFVLIGYGVVRYAVTLRNRKMHNEKPQKSQIPHER